MTEESAAQIENVTENDVIEEQIDDVQEGGESIEPTESAPVAASEAHEDGFQKRINKVTADKYAEKRRADALEKELESLRSKANVKPEKAPSLEDFDYDDDAYNKASIEYQVQKALESQLEKQRQESANQSAIQAQQEFNNRIAEFGKEDFADVANSVPELPPGVANALIQDDMGPELIYHLGTHLDQADRLANMTPERAMIELGRISANMSATKDIKTSAAPDPIEPLSSGGSIATERGPSGATFE